jgi:hypothetical protein
LTVVRRASSSRLSWELANGQEGSRLRLERPTDEGESLGRLIQSAGCASRTRYCRRARIARPGSRLRCGLFRQPQPPRPPPRPTRSVPAQRPRPWSLARCWAPCDVPRPFRLFSGRSWPAGTLREQRAHCAASAGRIIDQIRGGPKPLYKPGCPPLLFTKSFGRLCHG